jgi:enamine deaminase RidA (YjgF/YER057c/UK114 family)
VNERPTSTATTPAIAAPNSSFQSLPATLVRVAREEADGSIPSDVVARFDRAIAVMDKCLKAAGAGVEHVVKVQVFMTDITERPKINPRRIAYFGDSRPVSTLVEVKGLIDPRMKVEIERQAYVG